MEESRKQFEEWASHAYGADYMCRSPGKDGDYINWLIEDLWQGWQASRAAIEIDLPPQVDSSNAPFAATAWNAYRVDAAKSIRAAGLKIKVG